MKSAVWTNEFRLATLAAALILSGAGLPCPAADAPAAAPAAKVAPKADASAASTANASAEEIARWIEELDDNQFSVRQQATRKLSEAGEAAIDPLAIAAVTGSLEVSTRAIAALEANYLKTGEKSHKSAGLAEEALEQIMATANQSAALHAEQVLTFNDSVRQARAVEKIRELGGVIEYDDKARELGRIRETDEPVIAYVAIPKEWKGGDDGLKYVRRLTNLRYLYRIVGSPVSDGALNDLKKSIPDLEIQLRGALLGIEADRTDDECLVKVVKPGSAASKGGIRSGDIIKSFGGKPITDFLSLVELIKETQPGQEVPVVVLRNTGSVTLKVVMGGWSQSKP